MENMELRTEVSALKERILAMY